jgi:hypothetical protein
VTSACKLEIDGHAPISGIGTIAEIEVCISMRITDHPGKSSFGRGSNRMRRIATDRAVKRMLTAFNQWVSGRFRKNPHQCHRHFRWSSVSSASK